MASGNPNRLGYATLAHAGRGNLELIRNARHHFGAYMDVGRVRRPLLDPPGSIVLS
jgi:hypothetical protein